MAHYCLPNIAQAYQPNILGFSLPLQPYISFLTFIFSLTIWLLYFSPKITTLSHLLAFPHTVSTTQNAFSSSLHGKILPNCQSPLQMLSLSWCFFKTSWLEGIVPSTHKMPWLLVFTSHQRVLDSHCFVPWIALVHYLHHYHQRTYRVLIISQTLTY